jgi:hypothetical protein
MNGLRAGSVRPPARRCGGPERVQSAAKGISSNPLTDGRSADATEHTHQRAQCDKHLAATGDQFFSASINCLSPGTGWLELGSKLHEKLRCNPEQRPVEWFAGRRRRKNRWFNPVEASDTARRACVVGAVRRDPSACDSLTTREVTLLNYLLCRRGLQTPGHSKTVRRPSSAYHLRSFDLGGRAYGRKCEPDPSNITP